MRCTSPLATSSPPRTAGPRRSRNTSRPTSRTRTTRILPTTSPSASTTCTSAARRSSTTSGQSAWARSAAPVSTLLPPAPVPPNSRSKAAAPVNSPGNPPAKRHLGQILIDQGILTEDQLRIALLEQTKSHVPVGRLLVQLGFVSEATLRDALSEKLGLQAVDLSRIIVDPAAMKLVPRDMARRYRIFPVALDRGQKKFIVALADTNNIVALDQMRAHLKGDFELELRIAGDSEIERAIEHYYGHEFSIDGILKEIETGEIDYTSVAEGDEYSQPVVRLISALMADAVERGASDIHFEPEQNFLRIRYRIDGVLRQIRSLHKTYWPAMAVRLKVMAKMNIAETRADAPGPGRHAGRRDPRPGYGRDGLPCGDDRPPGLFDAAH